MLDNLPKTSWQQGECDKDTSGVNIKIILNLGSDDDCMPPRGPHSPIEPRFPDSRTNAPQQPKEASDETDWNTLGPQLLQMISAIDTHTDGAKEHRESEDGAIKAIDDETSRILWGKQDPGVKSESYQNANYSEKAAAGLMMDNKAPLQGNKDSESPVKDSGTSSPVDKNEEDEKDDTPFGRKKK